MSSNSDVLPQIGFNFIVKVVRIAVETVCYGIYLLLISFSTIILWYGDLYFCSCFLTSSAWWICQTSSRRGWRSRGTQFLLVVTLVMFAASSLFLAMDITDIVERLQIVLVDNPDRGLQEKEDQASAKVERWVWTGEMLFIFMLALGDSIVVWRTWALYRGSRKFLILPLLTWTGSVLAAFFELGCDIKTGWSLPDSNPSAGSVGSESCAKADTVSFSLSYATNIVCTSLILFKVWQHRQIMTRYFGSARRKTQAEKILTLLVESGAIYLALYTFQAIPIYGGSFSSNSLIAVEAVNAIIQQAMGMYPTTIVVLVEMQKSLWDTPEVSRDVSELQFSSRVLHVGQAIRGHSSGRTVILRSAGDISSSVVSDSSGGSVPEKPQENNEIGL